MNRTVTKQKFNTRDITFTAMFAALMAIGANITSMLVIGGVPITLQPFFALLAGLILGSRLGTISMLVYTLVGLVGVPVFAHFQGGLGTVLSPTFGFILSFIFTAYLTGKIIETKRTKFSFMFAAILGIIFIYLLGTNLMYVTYKVIASAPKGFTYKMLWSWMLVPLPKDILFAILAGALSPRLHQALNKTTTTYSNKAS